MLKKKKGVQFPPYCFTEPIVRLHLEHHMKPRYFSSKGSLGELGSEKRVDIMTLFN